MRKLILINMTYQNGSTGRIVENIHRNSNDYDFESYAFYTYYKSSEKNTFNLETKMEKTAKRVLVKLVGKYDFFALIPTLRLIKAIKRIDPSIIHIHNIHHQTFNYKMLFAFLKKLQIPIIYTLHDCWSFTGGCYYFTENKCNNYIEGCFECTKPKNQLDNPNSQVNKNYNIKKKLFSNFNNLSIVTVSDWLRYTASQSFLKGYQIRTIHNGIDINIFKSTTTTFFDDFEALKNKFIILGVANSWTKRKGVERFEKLAKIMSDEFHIVLIGNNINSDSVTNKITYINQMKSIEDLAKAYSSADVFINFSLEETFGLVTAEAMACGTPVIVLNSTANPEIVDENCGYIIEPDDIESVYEKIQLIKINGKEHYSRSCIKNVVENYSNDLMIKRYFELYEEKVHKIRN